jgi:hypothetical protein
MEGPLLSFRFNLTVALDKILFLFRYDLNISISTLTLIDWALTWIETIFDLFEKLSLKTLSQITGEFARYFRYLQNIRLWIILWNLMRIIISIRTQKGFKPNV